MKITRRIVIISALILALLVFMAGTNPKSMPIGMLLIPFVLFFLIIFNLSGLLMAMFRIWQNSLVKQRAAGAVLAITFTNFAVLHSMGGLTPQDVVLAIVITLIVFLYIAKFQISQR